MCFTSKRLQLGDFLKVKLSRLQVNTNHHKQTNQLPGATCFPSSCPLHNVGFFSDWEQTCRPSQVSFFDVVFFKLRENLQTCHGDLEKMMMTDEAGSKPGSFWLGRGLLEKSGHTKCWDTKVELVFFNLVTNKMFHTPPKLTWIHKMVVWKRWPLFKYGHFLGIYLKFLVGICRVL